MVYRRRGLIGLIKAFLKYPGKWLQVRYYQWRVKHTFASGIATIAMYVTQRLEAQELLDVVTSERSVMDEILKEIRPNDVFWDVGANLGVYSLLAANCAGVQVVAFEPHPATAKRLRKNVELNEKTNVKVLNIALSNSEGSARFDPIELDSPQARAYLVISDKISGTIEVETSSGDKLIEKGIVPIPDIVKIDVEGAEPLVIKGIGSSLPSCRALFCEVHPMYIEQYGSSAEDLESTLENMGFSVEKILDRVDGTYHIRARRLS